MTLRALLLAGMASLVTAPAAALTPFAPQLGDARRVSGPEDWPQTSPDQQWTALATAQPQQRQELRWNYALALLGVGRAADALGVLEVLAQDEPDLTLADAFALAHGRALIEVGRVGDALVVLSRPGLMSNPEACAWRLRAAAASGSLRLALAQVRCARAALKARTGHDRAAFLLPGVEAALAAGDPELALNWLRFVPGTPQARTLRGRALLASGKAREAAQAFAAVPAGASAMVRAEAELGRVETGLALHKLSPSAAARHVDALLYTWRGDAVEQRALWLRYRLARTAQDPAAALATGATLVRYHEPGARLPQLMGEVQATLATMLARGSRVPLGRAAGLYWEYRDLGPSGSDGDALALALADRLQEAGLYARAAGLLEHQLFERARDLAQGPLAVRVATLHILAGRPERALEALRRTSRIVYPAVMLHDRQRVEAIALNQLGRGREALTVLADVPGSGALYAELLWKQRSWSAFADLTGKALPPTDGLSEVRQAMILRHAIALGMVGREDKLARLRARYSAAFAELPTARAFDQLTAPAGALDPEQFARAMSAIPSATAAGELADLLEVAPASTR